MAGVGGILIIKLLMVLRALHIGGYLFPTLLAIAGLGSLLAGIGTGFVLVMDNFRYSRSQSYYDPDEEDD